MWSFNSFKSVTDDAKFEPSKVMFLMLMPSAGSQLWQKSGVGAVGQGIQVANFSVLFLNDEFFSYWTLIQFQNEIKFLSMDNYVFFSLPFGENI